jgi:hypothetical protein
MLLGKVDGQTFHLLQQQEFLHKLIHQQAHLGIEVLQFHGQHQELAEAQ